MRVSRPLRTLAAVAIAAAALLASSALAGARTLVDISGVATPSISAFTLTPQTLSLTIDARFSSDVAGELTGTVAKAVIYFPHGPRVNGALFPSCDPRRLQRMRGSPAACPAGSHLGGGTAIGTSPQFAGVDEHLRVELYNGARGGSIIFFLHGENPVAVAGMIVAPFTPLHGGRWGYRLTMNVPHGLQEIATGIFASLLDFKVTTGGSVRVRQGGRMVRYGFIEALACPPGALVPVRGVFDFLGGASTTTDSYIACGHR
ncbi:MAG TPA: hypothetical protein VFF79_10475 [Conexibacter sp.]|jgi:hypothetical protein|nr:hypothetical protein [Conexibacter sp.]